MSSKDDEYDYLFKGKLKIILKDLASFIKSVYCIILIYYRHR